MRILVMTRRAFAADLEEGEMPLKLDDIGHTDDDDLQRTLAMIGENFAMLAGALHELKRQIDRVSAAPAPAANDERKQR